MSSQLWQTAEVQVVRGYQSKLEFQAVMDGDDSDIAIDDIQLLNCNVYPLCSAQQFGCNDPTCINMNQVCDFEKDCADGEDEEGCGKRKQDTSSLFLCRELPYFTYNT